MNPFDELTLGEVEELTDVCLGGKAFTDANPLSLAGAVMYMHERRNDPSLSWVDFKNRTNMASIKTFSERMNEETGNPTNGEIPIPT